MEDGRRVARTWPQRDPSGVRGRCDCGQRCGRRVVATAGQAGRVAGGQRWLEKVRRCPTVTSARFLYVCSGSSTPQIARGMERAGSDESAGRRGSACAHDLPAATSAHDQTHSCPVARMAA
jgi:hypothetical protein